MQYYKIELTIGKDGSITEKVLASGSECTAVTKGLEKGLGEVISQELLPEYNQPTIAANKVNDEALNEALSDSLWMG